MIYSCISNGRNMMINRPSSSSGPQQDHIFPIPLQYQPLQYQPLLDLLGGGRGRYIAVARAAYEAAIKGDWEAVKPIIDNHPYLLRSAITENHETLLHIAASAECTKAVINFVRNLLALMERKDLKLQNLNHHTALNLAAAVGNLKIVRLMEEKYGRLIENENENAWSPLSVAAYYAKHEMTTYLYDRCDQMKGKTWDEKKRGWVLLRCVEAEIFDVALKILIDWPGILSKDEVVTDVLEALAQNTKAFKVAKPHSIFTIINSISTKFKLTKGPDEEQNEAVQLLEKIWNKIATKTKDDIYKIIRGPPLEENVKTSNLESERDETRNLKNDEIGYHSRILFLAVKSGNTPFVVQLIRLYPDLVWMQDQKGKTIFHVAVEHRQIEIYKLLYEIGGLKDLVTPIRDTKLNNMLHMVGNGSKQSYQNVSGAFQMQQELLWFKEVEQLIPPRCRNMKNAAGETPKELFKKKHADLVKDGKAWMRETASNGMVVATLITTIVFASVFTLPGGYKADGYPVFSNEPFLIIFVISNAFSFICSSTSILIFLSMLTSRYSDHVFLDSLPKRLLQGLLTLFLSIVTMMVTFSATFFVLYKDKVWVPATITCMAVIPVFLYVMLQYHLFWDVFRSAYLSKNLFKRNQRVLYS